MNRKIKSVKEWLDQADYDLKSAEIMLKGRSYVYVVFLCHLAVEKALKAMYTDQFQTEPPRIHNLNYFVEHLELDLKQGFKNFLNQLSDLSVPTRYPDEIGKLAREYNAALSKSILTQSKEFVAWLKKII